MNRRQCMISVGAAGMAGLASWASAQAPASSRPFFAHHAIPLGVQLYALQPDLEADFDGTLAKLNGIGIRSVEMAWFHGRTTKQIRTAFDRKGLQRTSAHIPAKSDGKATGLDGDLDALARDMHVIGVKQVVIAFPLLPRLPTSAEDFTAIISGLSAWDSRRMAAFLNDMGASCASGTCPSATITIISNSPSRRSDGSGTASARNRPQAGGLRTRRRVGSRRRAGSGDLVTRASSPL